MKAIAAAVLALGVALTPGFSQDTQDARPRPRQEAFGPRMMDHLEKALNLTPEQKAKADAIRTQHAGPLAAKRQAAQDARKAFGDAVKNLDAKAEDLRTLHRAAADADFELLLEFRTARREFRALLTPEQREQAARYEGRMEGRRLRQHGGFPEGGMR